MCDGSALVEDQPLHDDACWFRTITNEDHVTRDGTLHYQALKGTQFSPADPGKTWDHELSGRTMCLAGDVRKIAFDGEHRVAAIRIGFVGRGKVAPSKIKFVGVASARAIEIRKDFGAVRSDTAYTPFKDDPSHSDIVTFGTASDADVEQVRYWLQTTLRITSSANLHALVSSCGSSVAAA